jgi:tetratricopeptide (TPR) repeat protein
VGEYKFEKITGVVGVAKASSFKLSMANSFGIWRFLPGEYHTEAMINELIPLRDELPACDYHFNMGELYRLMGDAGRSRVHFDSARLILEPMVESSPNDYHARAKLGVAYALTGDFEKAVNAGRRAKELLSVDACHW